MDPDLFALLMEDITDRDRKRDRGRPGALDLNAELLQEDGFFLLQEDGFRIQL